MQIQVGHTIGAVLVKEVINEKQCLIECKAGHERLVSIAAVLNKKVKQCIIENCLFNYSKLKGRRFGKLLVTKDISPSSIEVKCACGRIFERNRYLVVSRKSESCDRGLCREGAINLTGQKFGLLTVVRFLECKQGKRKGTYWICHCECGKEHIVTTSSLLHQSVKSCGCASRRGINDKIRAKEGSHLISHIYGSYKRRAKQGNFPLSITKERMIELMKLPCHYCGEKEVGSITKKYRNLEGQTLRYNGLDRVDPTKGYTEENVVTCCKNCNWMKSDWSYDEFLSRVIKIASRFETPTNKRR